MKVRGISARYCVRCGSGLRLDDRKCPLCGKKVKESDRSCTKFTIWGFIFAFVGLILYFSYFERVPRKANSAAKGAIMGIVFKTLIVVVVLLLGHALSWF